MSTSTTTTAAPEQEAALPPELEQLQRLYDRGNFSAAHKLAVTISEDSKLDSFIRSEAKRIVELTTVDKTILLVGIASVLFIGIIALMTLN